MPVLKYLKISKLINTCRVVFPVYGFSFPVEEIKKAQLFKTVLI